jgi:(p)ppGpp synthase/HD superfamily hydrolase
MNHGAAVGLALKYHNGQKYGEHTYIYHLSCVVDSVLDANYYGAEVDVAYLHDILEDTACTEEELRQKFSAEVVDAVVAMTKQEGEAYEEYIKRVRSNSIAHVVKIHDTMCNLAESLKQNQIGRIAKYSKQMYLLTKGVN